MFIFRSIVIKAKVEPMLPVIEEIINGLNCYNIFNMIKQNPNVMRPVFCHGNQFEWHYEEFVNSLQPVFSEEGSSKRMLEVTTYKALLDVIEYCFNDGKHSKILDKLEILKCSMKCLEFKNRVL